MAEVSLLVTLVIVLVAAVVIFKIVKGVVQTVAIIGAVASIAVAVAGGFVVEDALDLRDDFQARDKLLLLSDADGKLITGGAVVKGQAGQAQAAAAESGNVKPLTADELEKLNSLFADKDYESMLGSNYKLIIVKESSLLGLKTVQDPFFLAAEYKKGSVIIYPETPVFKAVKILPLTLFKGVAGKLLQQTKAVTVQAEAGTKDERA